MGKIGTSNSAGRAQAFGAAYAAACAARAKALADERLRKKRRRPRIRRVMPEGLSSAEQRTWRLKEELRIDDAKKYAENARFEACLVKERLQHGFRLFVPRMIYGRWRENVHEQGFRSGAFGLPGRMFVAACRKGGELRASWDKANLSVESRSKLLSLDLPYIEGNKTFLGFWRIDLDATWPSVDAFIDEVRQLVGCELPFAPHLVAGDTLADGRFARPHLYFLLPPGEAVWNNPDDRRCNMRTVSFFEAIYYGIVDALKSLEADPGAPAKTQRGKNPLSPLATGFVMNAQEFMTISEWAGWVDTSLNREGLVRQRAADKAGVEIETSNEIFTAVQKEAYGILRRWHFDADPRLRAPEGAVADNLRRELEPLAQELVIGLPGRRRMSERQVALLVSRVASYAAGAFDPARLEKGIVRKALMHVVGHFPTVRERQQVAARYASTEKAKKTLQKLLEAWDCLSVETAEISKSALARAAGVSRPTVHARWAELQQVLEARNDCKVRCIDKKLFSSPAGMIRNAAVGHNPAQDFCPCPGQSTMIAAADGNATGHSNMGCAKVQRLPGHGGNLSEQPTMAPCPIARPAASIAIPEISGPVIVDPVTAGVAIGDPVIARATFDMAWGEISDDDDLDAEIIAQQEAFLAIDLGLPFSRDDDEPEPYTFSPLIIEAGHHRHRSVEQWPHDSRIGRGRQDVASIGIGMNPSHPDREWALENPYDSGYGDIFVDAVSQPVGVRIIVDDPLDWIDANPAAAHASVHPESFHSEGTLTPHRQTPYADRTFLDPSR